MPRKAAQPPVSVDVARRTLRQLVERLHPAVLDVLVAPQGLDVRVGDPVILDPTDTAQPPAGSVVLAVGVDSPHSHGALLAGLADTQVCAVVVKHTGALGDAVTAAAEAAGVAVLAAPPALTWGQLYTFLLTASAAGPQAESQPDAPLGDL